VSLRRDREFAEEIETHIRMLTQENLRAGMPPAEARRAAALRFGSVDAAVEGWREQRRLPLLDTVARDLVTVAAASSAPAWQAARVPAIEALRGE
jgi:hypothetical protein